MTRSIQPILLSLESNLKKVNAPVFNRLNPGIAKQDAKEIFKGLDLLEEIFELYAWKDGTYIDGTEKLGETWILPMGSFLSAERAMKCYVENAGSDDYWGLSKLPLFESRGGDYFLIDINTQSPTSGMVFYYSPSEVDFEVAISKYDSLETMLRSINQCIEQNAYSYKPLVGGPDTNFLSERKINRENNPGSEYWKLFN